MMSNELQESLIHDKSGCLGEQPKDDIFDDLNLGDLQIGISSPSFVLPEDKSDNPKSAGIPEANSKEPEPEPKKSSEPELVIAKVGTKIAKGVVKGAFKGVKYSVIKGLKFGLGIHKEDQCDCEDCKEEKKRQKSEKKEEKKKRKAEKKMKKKKKDEKPPEEKKWEKHLEYKKTKGKRLKKVKKVSKVFKGLKRCRVRLFKKKSGEYKKFSKFRM